MTDWQPIETAPKDELGPILLGADAQGRVFPMEWMSDWYGDKTQACWITANTDEEYGAPLYPTRWMPLPDPPKD